MPQLRIVKSFLAIVCFVSVSILLFFIFLLSHIFLPPSQSPDTVEVRVEPGEPFSVVARKLRDRRIIANATLFSLWAKIARSERKIHWGLYRFDLPLAPAEVLNRMVQGKGLFQKITVPEGLTVQEIAELLARAQVVDREGFLREADDPELLASLGLQGKGIEGYLYPSTYYFTPPVSPREIIMAMADYFRKVFNPLMDGQHPPTALSPHEIVTLASMIEKEAGSDSERPLVSAVFHNRLKLSMPLQSDPTVIYGLKNFAGNLTRKDLQNPSPYNTYRIAGLPPGPICNPSYSALKAALNPAPVPYLYFVSKNDGSHLFSENLEAHNRAVQTYQSGGRDGARK